MKLASIHGHRTQDDLAGFNFDGYLVQEKLDGVRAMMDGTSGQLIGRNGPLGEYRQKFIGCIFDGEIVGSEYVAFDLLRWRGLALDSYQLCHRLKILEGLKDRPIVARRSYNCQVFAEQIFAEGGEGVVAKLRDGTYLRGGWIRFKRKSTFDALVFSTRYGLANFIAETALGSVKVPEDVMVGDMIEVAAHSLTEAGLWREPRFVRTRKDK